MITRRHFHQSLACALASSILPVYAQNSESFISGKDFRPISNPAPTPDHGKVDVVEFFMYSCPHCHAFEPSLEKWTKSLPNDVALRRVPAVFGALPELFAKLYYTLEILGLLSSHHARFFAAIHIQKRKLDKFEDIQAWAVENNIDKKLFSDTFQSFGVATKIRQGNQLTQAYGLDGVPTMGIHGRWVTSVSMAGSAERALAVVNHLIGQARPLLKK